MNKNVFINYSLLENEMGLYLLPHKSGNERYKVRNGNI